MSLEEEVLEELLELVVLAELLELAVLEESPIVLVWPHMLFEEAEPDSPESSSQSRTG